MTRLRPFLPYDPAETPVSWATRLAAFHTGEGVIPFLNDLGVPLSDILVNRRNSIDRLCEATGEDPEKIFANCIQLQSWRQYTLRGIHFTLGFLHGKFTLFCPACLHEDDAKGGVAGSRRLGRTAWLLRHVRTCDRHHLPLVKRGGQEWSDKLRQLQVIVPEAGGQLAALADSLTQREPSSLQSYLLARLAGGIGPEWLDHQPIEAAARATEMIGVVLAFGPKPNLTRMTADDWDTAGRVGFEFSARGPNGVRDALSEMQESFLRSKKSKVSLAGPQMVFGRLYQWLEFSGNNKDPGLIKQLLREHILDTMKVEPGKLLLGVRVEVRRRHDVQSLAQATGADPRTVRNFLMARGMIPADPSLAKFATVDAKLGEQEVALMRTAVSQKALPKLLNTTRGQVTQLIQAGFLPLRTDMKRRRLWRSCPREAVESFLADLKCHAHVVDEKPSGMAGIPETAQLVFVPTPTIVKLIISGRLRKIVRLAEIPGYSGILVDPEEVRRIAKPSVPAIAIPVYRAAERLGFALGVVNALVSSECRPPLLQTIRGRGRAKVLVELKEVDRFSREHVGLTKLSKEVGIHHLKLRQLLDAAGTDPIGDPKRLKARIYRRDEILLP